MINDLLKQKFQHIIREIKEYEYTCGVCGKEKVYRTFWRSPDTKEFTCHGCKEKYAREYARNWQKIKRLQKQGA